MAAQWLRFLPLRYVKMIRNLRVENRVDEFRKDEHLKLSQLWYDYLRVDHDKADHLMSILVDRNEVEQVVVERPSLEDSP